MMYQHEPLNLYQEIEPPARLYEPTTVFISIETFHSLSHTSPLNHHTEESVEPLFERS
jgi:hypothetical protein